MVRPVAACAAAMASRAALYSSYAVSLSPEGLQKSASIMSKPHCAYVSASRGQWPGEGNPGPGPLPSKPAHVVDFTSV
jgi:hypothetical protein